MHQSPERSLLILDIDETLVYSTEQPLERPADFVVGPYHGYRRPGVGEFIRRAARSFHLAVWTTSSAAYARGVLEELVPVSGKQAVELAFVWSRQRCQLMLHPVLGVEVWVKDLEQVTELGYRLERTLIVDDSAEKACQQPDNLVQVPLFLGDVRDRYLERLANYLSSLADVPDVRKIDKRTWHVES